MEKFVGALRAIFIGLGIYSMLGGAPVVADPIAIHIFNKDVYVPEYCKTMYSGANNEAPTKISCEDLKKIPLVLTSIYKEPASACTPQKLNELLNASSWHHNIAISEQVGDFYYLDYSSQLSSDRRIYYTRQVSDDTGCFKIISNDYKTIQAITRPIWPY